MIIRLVNSDELDILLSTVRQTFIDTYEQLNDDNDFQAYLHTHFTLETLQAELKNCPNNADTEGVANPTKKECYYFAMDEGVNGYFKINIHKSPLEAVSPIIYASETNFKNLKALEIERIYVVKNAKGRGVGRLMMAEIQTLARQNSCSYIWLGVWTENTDAIAFYEKMGFKVFGEHIFMMGNDAQTDLLMMKMLD